jgi:outer membrane lipoprotein
MTTKYPLLFFIGCLALVSCAVIPSDETRNALPEMPFNALIQAAGHHIGATVILGGYVVEVENQKDQTRIVAVQAPLGLGQEPQSKDLSQGRLIIVCDGFIDPEIYSKDRKITVAGKLVASSATQGSKEPFPHVTIRMSHIHLWSKEKPPPPEPYWDYWGYPPFPFGPYPWGWRHPYWR